MVCSPPFPSRLVQFGPGQSDAATARGSRVPRRQRRRPRTRGEKFSGSMSEVRARDRLLELEGCSIAGDQAESLTVDELRDAIRSFSRADNLRLRKAGCLFSDGTELDWKSLLQEAVLRVLDGTRRC